MLLRHSSTGQCAMMTKKEIKKDKSTQAIAIQNSIIRPAWRNRKGVTQMKNGQKKVWLKSPWNTLK